MTYEEILNIDWAEQKDLTEYANLFEQVSIMNSQLAKFSYGYLRNKLMTWKEIVEEGLSNFCFLNFAMSEFSGFIGEDIKRFICIVPVCKNLNSFKNIFGIFRSHPEFIHYDFKAYYCSSFNWSSGCLTNILDVSQEMFPNQPRILSDAMTLLYLLESSPYKRYISTSKHFKYEKEQMAELIQAIKANPLITIIEIGIKPEDIIRPKFFCGGPFLILSNQEVIKLGLYKKISEYEKVYENLINENLIEHQNDFCYWDYSNHKCKKEVDKDALYWINELRQPIYLTNESKFNQDYCTTKINKEKNIVKFSFKNISPYRRNDNTLVYEETNYGRFDEILVDICEDKIIEDYERVNY